VPSVYYEDDLVQLHCGDCRDITAWLAADVLITDPPYGRDWRQGMLGHNDGLAGIIGDKDTSLRDWILEAWGNRPAIMFGDLMLPPPAGCKQVLAYRKTTNSGVRGATGGFRRDLEAIYLIGAWPSGIGGRSSLLATNARSQGGEHGLSGRYGHPHAKPVDVMETLIGACPDGVIADPCAGGGSTLIAARNLGRKIIGVEIDEQYCREAAKRLAQQPLAL